MKLAVRVLISMRLLRVNLCKHSVDVTIHTFVLSISVALLQGDSEALPTQHRHCRIESSVVENKKTSELCRSFTPKATQNSSF